MSTKIRKKYKDIEIDDKFGKWVVIGEAESRISKTTGHKIRYWNCRCECGNPQIYQIRDNALKNGTSTSCGCSKINHIKQVNDNNRIKNDLTGRRFFKLYVESVADYYIDTSNNRHPIYQCKCDCGSIIYVKRQNLVNGHVKSCGCTPHDYNMFYKDPEYDLVGKTFGFLLVKEYVKDEGLHNKRRGYWWMCQCKCGSICYATTSSLISGKKRSCGCISSWAELIIKNILEKNYISFMQQYSFDELRGIRNGKLRFDFAILDNNNVQYLIEYDGVQHYTEIVNRGKLSETQEHDKRKNEYCKKHNIPLIRLPYLDPYKITIDDLKIETSQYLVA